MRSNWLTRSDIAFATAVVRVHVRLGVLRRAR
jgi:hypothetical protein